MKKRMITTILVVMAMMQLLVGQVAQTQNTEGKSFLWEIKKGDVKAYILGSIHMFKEDMYPLKPAIETAFDKSEILAVEAEVTPDKLSQLSMMMMKKGFYQGEDSLKKNISEKTYTLLKEWLTKNNMKVEQFAKFKPWFVAASIEGMEAMKLGFKADIGIDLYFMKKAAGKKEIVELEGFDFQLNLFNSFTAEENESFLFSALQDAKDTNATLGEMVKAWQNGDAKHIEATMTDRLKKNPEIKGLFKKLIDDRNFTMCDKIITLLQEKKNCMVIVGSAHLTGKTGLIRLLEEKGFTLTQL